MSNPTNFRDFAVRAAAIPGVVRVESTFAGFLVLTGNGRQVWVGIGPMHGCDNFVPAEERASYAAYLTLLANMGDAILDCRNAEVEVYSDTDAVMLWHFMVNGERSTSPTLANQPVADVLSLIGLIARGERP